MQEAGTKQEAEALSQWARATAELQDDVTLKLSLTSKR
jgi:hypothetical protein